ncbi:MAG TPA: glutaminyl-peptide cyclotransferase [Clostridiales bacterium]|nr:glutaminyl-peptide cyclotransferase [Clostridiales bacterium]HQP68868.1 glutaminyl-peptide cyclotransferase [Clostridiales bacterium]
MKQLTFILTVIIIFAGCSNDKPSADVTPPAADYEIINIYPHDTSFFTQGFEFKGDTLLESTGKEYYSKVISYNIFTPQIYKEISIPSDVFGEGITELNGQIFQLTWQNEKGYVYDSSNLSKLREFSYSGEGWGICNDGTELIMSDGSEKLYFRNPESFNVTKTVIVKDSNGVSCKNLNELEYADGKIYANLWGYNFIVCIDPLTGMIVKKYDLSGLLSPQEYYEADVLNGIAFRNGHFFVTGKFWPKIFELKLND